MTHNNKMPIGIFDSGVGGLTVMKEIITLLPKENIIYLGDTARVPYGIRSAKTVTRYSCESAQFLVTRNVKLLVVACNTSSSTSLLVLKEKVTVPVVGVIEPGARAAAVRTEKGRVAVIGTEATIASGSYEMAIKSIDASIQVSAFACPLFVPLVEEGWINGDVVRLTAERYLSGVRSEGVDVLVLGCTHYPLIKDVIADTTGTPLVDSAIETALEVKNVLSITGMLNTGDNEPEREYYVTDSPDKFRNIGERFLGHEVPDIRLIDLGG